MPNSVFFYEKVLLPSLQLGCLVYNKQDEENEGWKSSSQVYKKKSSISFHYPAF